MATTTAAPATVRITFGPIGETEPAPREKISKARQRRIDDATPYPLTVLVPKHTRTSRPAAEAYVAGYIHCHTRMWMPEWVGNYTAVVTIDPDNTGRVQLVSGAVVHGEATITPGIAGLIGIA